jgi:hypothetical protein
VQGNAAEASRGGRPGRPTTVRGVRALPLALVLTLTALPAGAAATTLREARPADDAPHAATPRSTEWWYANAIDPGTGLAVAVSLGPTAPGSPPSTVAFVYPPGGGAHVLLAPRLTGVRLGRSATGGPDVRMGPDRFTETAPGTWRVRVSMPTALALAGGSPGLVAVDLTLRRRTPGFLAGPLAIEGDRMSWTVAAPAAAATGTVRVGGRTFRLRDAPAYHDHNFGPFRLDGARLAGWDWAQLHLSGGRALALGLVKTVGATRPSGGAVLLGPRRRIAAAPAADVRVRYGDWRRAAGFLYPARERVGARLSDGSVARLRLTALRAAPLGRGGTAIVEILARGDGEIRRGGRVVARLRAAPGFYEYESTPAGRARDGAPGRLSAGTAPAP